MGYRRINDLALWSARAALVGLMMNAEDPFRLAFAALVLSLQLPLQRAIFAWKARTLAAALR